jgi:clan AA aspartic protease (TIGR02281 family)
MFGTGDISIFLALALSGSAVFYANTASNGQPLPGKNDTFAAPSINDTTVTARGLRIKRSADRLFYLDVTLDGVRTKAILDTGATQSVLNVATLEQIAQSRGQKRASLKPHGSIQTLNGKLSYSVLPIEDVRVSGIRMGAVNAVVVAGHDVPIILGQDVIARFASVTIEADQLVLRWKPSSGDGATDRASQIPKS